MLRPDGTPRFFSSSQNKILQNVKKHLANTGNDKHLEKLSSSHQYLRGKYLEKLRSIRMGKINIKHRVHTV